jgi:hypothetical protein
MNIIYQLINRFYIEISLLLIKFILKPRCYFSSGIAGF